VTARSDGNCQPVDVTVENFDEIVMRRDGRPVLVGFWAPGCRPSAAVSAILASLAADFSDAAVIARVNVEQDDALADAARVDVVPTLHLIWQGRLVDVILGACTEQQLRARLLWLATKK
jgi:putative thioredoxin